MFAPKLPDPKDYKRPRGLGGVLIRNPYEIARKQYTKRLEQHKDEFFNHGYLAMEKTIGPDGEVAKNADGEPIETGNELWRVSARVGALKDIDYGEFVHNIKAVVEPVLQELPEGGPGIKAVYTGLVPLVYKSQRSLLDGLLFGFVMDLVVVTIVMTLAVREWSAGLVL